MDRKRKIDDDGVHAALSSAAVASGDADGGRPLSVGIVGGGIAGLSAALALQQNGFTVSVFERDTMFSDRRQGYGLTLVNNPKGPLFDLGLLDRCVTEDCPSNAHWLFKPDGAILGYFGRAFKAPCSSSSAATATATAATASSDGGKVEGRGNLRIPRQNLRKMMMDKLAPGTVQWGMKIVDYEEHADNVVVRFQRSGSGGTGGGDEVVEVVEVTVDVLVGADGIRSLVRQLRAAKPGRILSTHTTAAATKPLGETSPLRYVGVAVILGITSAQHPLITQQGFYCVDGTHRLFTMPFEGESERADDTQGGGTKLTMWQLSFSDLDEAAAARLRASPPDALLGEARRRTAGWFAPIPAMIDLTPAAEVWATGLYDRDPMAMWPKDRGSRVTVMGDACHPMSMFKGQGANQALQDGPLLASWLRRDGTFATARNVYTRLKCFEREMVARARSKVQASREAAGHLHSAAVLGDAGSFEGVPAAGVGAALRLLAARGVGAALGGTLEGHVKEVLATLPTDAPPAAGDGKGGDEEEGVKSAPTPAAAAAATTAATAVTAS